MITARDAPVCGGCGEPSTRLYCDKCKPLREAKRAGIPEGYRWAALGRPELRAAVKLARNGPTFEEVLDSIRSAERVVISGPQGSGKTSLATALLRERVPDALWISARKLGTARIQHAAGHGEPPLVTRASEVGVLLLDDVGEEQKTATNAVPDVIDERFARGLPTWITTGRNGGEIAELYGGGIMRRAYERAFILRLGGP